MSDATEVLQDVLHAWDIAPVTDVAPLGRRTFRVRTDDGERYVLKQDPLYPDVPGAVRMLSLLAAQGLGVGVPLFTRQGLPSARVDGSQYLLYTWQDGTVVRDHYAPGAKIRARRFGEAIGRLHEGLAECNGAAGTRTLDLPGQVNGWVRDSLTCRLEGKDLVRLQKVYDVIDAELASVYDRLPKQLIHRDTHPSNLIFDGRFITGYIDFELITVGVRIFDPAYCSTSILMDGFADSRRKHRWLNLLGELVAGYDSVIRLTRPERERFWHVQLCIQLLYAAFYDRHGSPELSELNLSALWWLFRRRTEVEEVLAASLGDCD